MGYKFASKTRHPSAKTESITIVLERTDLMDSGFWVKIIDGIEKWLNWKGISAFLSAIENDEDEFMPLSITQMKTNGIMILGQIPIKHILTVIGSGLPVVLIDSF